MCPPSHRRPPMEPMPTPDCSSGCFGTLPCSDKGKDAGGELPKGLLNKLSLSDFSAEGVIDALKDSAGEVKDAYIDFLACWLSSIFTIANGRSDFLVGCDPCTG